MVSVKISFLVVFLPPGTLGKSGFDPFPETLKGLNAFKFKMIQNVILKNIIANFITDTSLNTKNAAYRHVLMDRENITPKRRVLS